MLLLDDVKLSLGLCCMIYQNDLFQISLFMDLYGYCNSQNKHYILSIQDRANILRSFSLIN